MPRPSYSGLISILFVIFACLSTQLSYAKGERYGVSVASINIDSVDYDEGASGSGDMMRFGIVHTRPIDVDNNRWRWWFGLNYLDGHLDAPNNGVYQEMKNLELRIVPQFALTQAWAFTPYLGAGLSLGYTQYKNRWAVDNEGFRQGAQLEDISQVEAGLVIAGGTVIKLGSDPEAHIQIIPQASYIVPIYNDGIGGLELSLSLLF